MAEWRNNGDEGRVGLLLGRSIARVKEKVLVRLGSTGLLWEMCSSGEKEISDVWHLCPCLWHLGPCLSSFLPLTSQSFPYLFIYLFI